ncbi:hypothetical protein AB0C04_15940 [Micromonospora sp. NPDC048909]|uniref:hypothetical protein n=1 Tax=Micromonospora sp. NPDC048909 TaxID=3155643 RepID=UPI0033D91E81
MSVRTPGVAIAAAALASLLLTGCGGGADEPAATASPIAPSTSVAAATTTAAASPTPAVTTPAASPVDKQITVTVAKRRVDPPTGRVTVAKGDLVRITVTSDVPDELHVHGYDLGARLPAGKAGSVEFRADRTGLFEVETHETELVLFQLVVR